MFDLSVAMLVFNLEKGITIQMQDEKKKRQDARELIFQ